MNSWWFIKHAVQHLFTSGLYTQEYWEMFNERVVLYFEKAYMCDSGVFNEWDSLKDIIIAIIEKNKNPPFQGWRWSELDPQTKDEFWASCLGHIGEALRRLKKYDKSIDYLEVALKLNPELAFGYISRRLVYQTINSKELVRDDLDKLKAFTKTLLTNGSL